MEVVTFEVVLSGDHKDIFVMVDAPRDIAKKDLLIKACEKAMDKTYIWSYKIAQKNNTK